MEVINIVRRKDNEKIFVYMQRKKEKIETKELDKIIVKRNKYPKGLFDNKINVIIIKNIYMNKILYLHLNFKETRIKTSPS